MEKKFKDRVLGFYRRTIYKHRWMRIPLMPIMVILLALDRVGRNISSNSRKIMGVGFTLVFAFISCSFSGSIWGDETSEFVTDNAPTQVEVEDSDAKLADESSAYENVASTISSSAANPDSDDDYDESAISGADILNNINIDELDVENEDDAGSDSQTEFDRDDWRLILVNKQHPIDDDYNFNLGTIMSGMQCDERVIPDLYRMIEAAYDDGVNLVISSPYRPASRQEMLFDRKVTKYTSQGMSYMEAYKLAAQAVTIPGCSEHQIGLAFDITCDSFSSLTAGFGETTAGKWLAEHSAEYGFIVRYPDGKEEITGIEYEPWHFRYVGKAAAQVITEEGITLEEFWEKYL